MEQYEVSDTDSVVGELHEVAMVGDLDVAEDFELGPDDVPPTDDESELGDESIRGSDEDMEPEFDAAEAGEASGLQTIDEPVDDLSVQQLTAHTSAVFAVAVNAAQPHLFATGGGDDVGYLWRLGGAEPVARLQGHSETISSMAFSSDGAYLATGGLDGIVRVWAADTGAPVVALEGPTQGINWVCWHVRGAVLLAGSEDATAWMWKVPEGSVMQIFSAHSASVSYGGFVNGGRSVITASEDGTVRVWNPRAGTVEHCTNASSPQEPLAITCIASHPSQAVYVLGIETGAVKLAHAETGKLLAVLSAHEASVESVAFCDCMPLLASAGMDGKLCVWDLNTYSLRHTCKHGAGVVEVLWRRDAPLVFTCSVSRELRLWDARSGVCLNAFSGHRDTVLCMAAGYPEGGMYLVSGSDDHSARVWSVDV